MQGYIRNDSGVLPVLLALVAATLTTACTGVHMKPYYPQNLVQSLQVRPDGERELLLRFYVQPESLHYASGVNYEVRDGVTRVVIDRCTVRQSCSTMIKHPRTLSADDDMEVRIPYAGGPVVLVHADTEQRIYP